MAHSRLSIYNIAASHLGEEVIDSLTDDSTLRRKLDNIWTRGNGTGHVRHCLEQGFWNHAMRSVKIDSDSAVTPSFGYKYAFSKPTDFCKLAKMCQDELFDVGLIDYEDEVDYWYAHIDPIYVSYVSDDTDFGNDLSKWPETFADWVGHTLAMKVSPSLMGKSDVIEVRKINHKLMMMARGNDAMNDPTRFPQTSSWVRARHRGSRRRDNGNRNRLTG